MDPLRWVKYYATKEHDGGPTYRGLHYTHHYVNVEAVLRRFGITDEDILTACWLHDLKEDRGVKIKTIAEMFGKHVAELVDGVSDEPGANRKIRHALTYPKTRSIKGAVTLKLADRISNVEGGGELVEMYRKEHEDFKRALYTPGENEEMWSYLDHLLRG